MARTTLGEHKNKLYNEIEKLVSDGMRIERMTKGLAIVHRICIGPPHDA